MQNHSFYALWSLVALTSAGPRPAAAQSPPASSPPGPSSPPNEAAAEPPPTAPRPASSGAPPPTAPAPGPSAEPRLDGESLLLPRPGGPPARIGLSCRGRGYVVSEQRVVVACGSAGVVVVDASTGTITARLRTPGDAVDAFQRDGRVWIEVAETSARRLKDLAPAAAASGPPAAPAPRAPESGAHPASMQAIGRVLEARGNELVVSLGTDNGVDLGDHIEVFIVRRETVADGRVSASYESVLVGEVVSVARDRARISIGLGESAPVGAAARKTDKELSRSLVAPPRIADMIELAVTARPFLPVNDLGVGVLGDAAVTYRAKLPIFARLRLNPLGVGIASQRDRGVVGGNLVAGYDHDLFEIGIGVGFARVEDRTYIPSSSPTTSGHYAEKHEVVLTGAQSARIGARDGLNLQITNSFVLVHPDFEGRQGREFRYGDTLVSGQIPLGQRTWLILRGGGSDRLGYAFGEIGVRRLVTGDGGPGSLFVSPAIGGAAVLREEAHTIAGPMIGVGLEWRL